MLFRGDFRKTSHCYIFDGIRKSHSKASKDLEINLVPTGRKTRKLSNLGLKITELI